MWGDNSTYHSTRPPSATTPGLSLSRPDSASFQVQTCFLTSKYFLGMQSIKHKFKLWKMTILNSCRHEHTELRGWHPGTQIELSCIFKSTTYKTRRDSSQVDSSNHAFPFVWPLQASPLCLKRLSMIAKAKVRKKNHKNMFPGFLVTTSLLYITPCPFMLPKIKSTANKLQVLRSMFAKDFLCC